MIEKAQKARTASKTPVASVGGVREKPKAPVGHGNHIRANALQPSRILQAKLAIGKSNDPFEHEADRVANEVMGMPSKRNVGSLHTASDRMVQRKCACGGACDDCKKKRLSLKRRDTSSHDSSEVPASVDQVLRSAGQPLDANTRAFMEPRFGYDFSDVRVHTNSAAAQSARDVHALAFTVGNHVAFGAGQYSPGSPNSNRLLAHELAHVVQQGGAGTSESGQVTSGVIQRAGNPAFLPDPFPCPHDLTPGRPAGTDLLFPTGGSTITATHTAQLRTFVTAWAAAGGTDEITIHGYASTLGDEGPNWTLSCERAENVRTVLRGLGVPEVHLRILAHGESTDFGASNAPNQHAVVSSSPGGLFSPPIVFAEFTPIDDFAGRSHVRFGVDEFIFLGFSSLPPRPAADFGGLEWFLISGGGTFVSDGPVGTGTYHAPATAATVSFEIRVASGPSAGRVVAAPTINIVEPSAINLDPVAGSFPDFGGWGAPTIPAGTWGAGFRAEIFVDPKDVSFWGVNFSEGGCPEVVTPPGSFLAGFGAHTPGGHGPGGQGNSVTGTRVNPPSWQDGVWFWKPPAGNVMGIPFCGVSNFLWAIPWLFTVGGGAPTPFAGGFVANQRVRSTLACNATVEKRGGGPFCRRINGTTC
jgi:outer membrane protein OmpA-like peptidoglycan-associated protein